MATGRAALILGMLALAACAPPGATPDASAGDAASCLRDDDCDDGLFCNGVEVCAAGECIASDDACPSGRACDEPTDRCLPPCAGDPDPDGDGEPSRSCGGGDCADDDTNRFPGNVEVCDADDHDEDCDPSTFGVRDADGDAYADAQCCNTDDTGSARCGTDCDDASAGVHPSLAESCDARDNDCDEAIDEGAMAVLHRDADGDLHGFGPGVPMCADAPGYVPNDRDCDDAEVSVHPGAAERCNAIDDDCDDETDEGSAARYYPDCDGDAQGNLAIAPVLACEPPPALPSCGLGTGAWVTSASDCNDTDASVRLGAIEACNGRDDDCDGAVDGDAASAWCIVPARLLALHASAATCAAGACMPTSCSGPFLDCSTAPGCESDASRDPSNCGGCGVACTWDCAASSCDDPIQLSVGGDRTCARRPSGALACWGSGGGGGLGDGTRIDRSFPAPVLGIPDAIAFEAGPAHSCAVRSSGAVMCWGTGGSGQIGDGARVERTVPTAVLGLTDAVDVALAGSGTCALRASGAVVCWGTGGTLGDGSGVSDRTSPAANVSGISDATRITAGFGHVCALRSSGSVVCWGFNGSGALGDGTTTFRTTPVAVSGLVDAVEIDAGGYHTCARRASGEVRCWGRGTEVGDGTTADRLVPTSIGVADATLLAAGSNHSCVRRATGAVLCWGANEYGELGDGTTLDRLSPVLALGVGDALELGAGADHTCARLSAGELRCWGRNFHGQLGDRTTIDRLTPVVVSSP